MTIRGLERFAVGSLLVSIALIAVDRIRHPRGFFFLIPMPRHALAAWRPVWFSLRTRPAFTLGVLLLLIGLCVGLIAVCAEVGTVLVPRETDR
ncbi:MAG TPA: hypothetical protein VJO52_05915 [Gemmatimonadaceae bacterium]|nr:hypothetical protein [Gemmatimonadaceae bacterium]